MLSYFKSQNFLHLAFTDCKFPVDITDTTEKLLQFYNEEIEHFMKQESSLGDDACNYLVQTFASAGVKIITVDLSSNLLTSASEEAITNMIKAWKVEKLNFNFE